MALRKISYGQKGGANVEGSPFAFVTLYVVVGQSKHALTAMSLNKRKRWMYDLYLSCIHPLSETNLFVRDLLKINDTSASS